MYYFYRLCFRMIHGDKTRKLLVLKYVTIMLCYYVQRSSDKTSIFLTPFLLPFMSITHRFGS